MKDGLHSWKQPQKVEETCDETSQAFDEEGAKGDQYDEGKHNIPQYLQGQWYKQTHLSRKRNDLATRETFSSGLEYVEML